MVIILEIPSTAWRKISSHIAKACSAVVSLEIIPSRRSLGITITASTSFCSSASPRSASNIRCLPSKIKGLVTTATVRAPCSLAVRAMTGIAPVPVPPPRPPETKTMSAPLITFWISSRLSSAALRPISGSIPVPRPRVRFLPIWTFFWAPEACRCWASVFMAINSTPRTLALTIWFTALVPDPPTPTTLMRAKASISGWILGMK